MNDSTRAAALALAVPNGPPPARPNSAAPSADASSPVGGFVAFMQHESIAIPLLLLYLLTVLLVSPKGAFPLNDDWVYTKSVQGLIERGSYAGHPFAAALTVAQMYWGGLFCKLFGFSFTILRISTLVLSFAGAWATARSALVLGLTRWPAILCGALLFASPLVLNLSYTFMSDVPFMSFTALCGLFYLRALHTPSASDLAWGSLFGVLSVLTRQFGVLMPVAYGAAAGLFVFQRRYRLTAPMIASFVGVWIAGAAVFLYFHFTKEPGLSMPIPEPPHSLIRRAANTAHYAATALTYLGLFALPLAPAAAVVSLRTNGRWSLARVATVVVVSAVIFASLCSEGLRRLPELGIGNMLYDLGVGPMTMSDAYFGLTNWMPVRLGHGWWLFTIGAVFTAALLLLRSWDAAVAALRAPKADAVDAADVRLRFFLFLWGGAMIACPWNPWLPRIFDRYFVGAVVPVILFLAVNAFAARTTWTTRFALAGVVVFYAFSLASLHDYLGWNQARWTVITQLMDERHVPANHIDGGFEFNGMYTSDEFMKLHNTRNFFESSAGQSGYWVLDNEYVIGICAPRRGYEKLLSAPYYSWLGLRPREVIAFHRTTAPNA